MHILELQLELKRWELELTPGLELEPTALDNSSTVSDFANVWRFFIHLIIHKFNPNVLIIPSTILSANNHFITENLVL